MDSSSTLYESILLEHHKNPRNHGPLPHATHRSQGRNPRCGDEVFVHLQIVDGRIAAAGFQAHACAITRASASILSESLTGKTVPQARRISSELLAQLQGDSHAKAQCEQALGEHGGAGGQALAAIIAVRRYTARIACAALPWQAAVDALAEADESATRKVAEAG